MRDRRAVGGLGRDVGSLGTLRGRSSGTTSRHRGTVGGDGFGVDTGVRNLGGFALTHPVVD